MNNIAILGGTFDPVHAGHLALLHEVANGSSYNKFILIPASVSNFKKEARPAASDKERLDMLSLAVKDYNSSYPDDLQVEISISDAEVKRGGISYTYDTVVQIKKELNITEKIGFIIGDDHISRLKEWYKYDELKKEVRFIICPRLKDEADWDKLDRDLDYVRLDVANTYEENSTNVRNDFLTFSSYLTSRVRSYALKHFIYFKTARNIGELDFYLKNTVSEKRYVHSLGVAKTVRKIMERYHLHAETEEWNGFNAYDFCGLAHDLAREMPDKALNEYCHSHNLILDEDEEAYPVLSHGIVSADIAERLCGDYPAEWKDAIRVHTSGSGEMGSLALALFAADFIEPSRVYLTEEKREEFLSEPSLEACAYAILHTMMEHWKEKANITATGKTLAMKEMLEEKTGYTIE